MESGLVRALLGTFTVTFCKPTATGENFRLKVQLLLGAIVCPEQLSTGRVNRPLLEVSVPRISDPAPLFGIVTVCVELPPAVTFPNTTGFGEYPNIGATPLPVNEIESGLVAALSGTLMAAG